MYTWMYIVSINWEHSLFMFILLLLLLINIFIMLGSINCWSGRRGWLHAHHEGARLTPVSHVNGQNVTPAHLVPQKFNKDVSSLTWWRSKWDRNVVFMEWACRRFLPFLHTVHRLNLHYEQLSGKHLFTWAATCNSESQILGIFHTDYISHTILE